MKRTITFLVFSLLLLNIVHAQQTVTGTLISEGTLRHYRVYLPKGYVSGNSLPLIVHLHGYSSTAALDQTYTNYMPIADTAGFMTAYPDGLIDTSGNEYWNVGWLSFPNKANDVQFISTLIDTLHNRYNVNLNKVYATGLSNGAFLAYQLAVQLNNKITAIASVSGSMYPPFFNGAVPWRVVPVMEIHGTADAVIPYAGNSGTLSSINIDTLMNFWALNDNCNPVPIIDTLPNTITYDGSRPVKYTFSNNTNSTQCILYKLLNGQHGNWPGSPSGGNRDYNASIAIWEFFKQYSLQQFAGIEHVPGNEQQLQLLPNPATNHVLVSLAGGNLKGPVKVKLLNVMGQIVKEYGFGNNQQLSLDISRLTRGYYLLQVVSGNTVYTGKLIRQ